MRTEVVIAGFGGQGIILMGVVLAEMMELFPGKYVAQAQSYGPVSRGGACRTDVIISDRSITYPKCIHPNVMIFMSQESVSRYLREGDPRDTVVVYDATLVDGPGEGFARVFPVFATRTAEEVIGQRLAANMLMLGFAIDLIIPGGFEMLKKTIAKSLPKASHAFNFRALDEGREHWLAAEGKEK